MSSINIPNLKEKNSKINLSMIKEVYEDNFKEEIRKLSVQLEKYKFISMDTEFPGVIYHPKDNSREQYYQSIKTNVDALKLIQVGITICDADGNYPKEVSTWQFNLKFDLNKDQYSSDSISLLSSCGINFETLSYKGIPNDKFGEYLMVSGLLLNDDISWVSFHGIYDFAYLLKIITGLPLPESECLFFESLKLYFPHYYDIRYLVRYTENLRGSLNKLGQELNINRIGVQHQAGSDSIITSEIFFKLKSEYFSDDSIRGDKNNLFGIGGDEYESSFTNNYYMMNNINNLIPQVYNKMPQGNSSNVNYNDFSNNYYSQTYNYSNIPYQMMPGSRSTGTNLNMGSYVSKGKLNPQNITMLNPNINTLGNVNMAPYAINFNSMMNNNFNMQMLHSNLIGTSKGSNQANFVSGGLKKKD
jgi:CCR4-NOT transcription complex subunit 7/8